VNLRESLRNLKAFRANPLELFREKAAGGDGVSFFGLGVRQAALVTVPDAAKALLTHPDFAKDARPFGVAGTFRGFSILKDLIGDGLAVLDGEEAAVRRKWVLPAYSSAQRGWITRPPSNTQERLEQLLGEYPPEDTELSRVLSRLIFEQFCAVMFGKPYVEWSEEVIGAIEAANRMLHVLSKHFMPWAHVLGGADAALFRKSRQTLFRFAARVVEDLHARIDAPGPTPLGFMALPLAELTAEQQLSEVVTQLVGGTESTSLTASWTALLLAQHPDWWSQVQAQVDSTAPDELRRLPLSSPTPLPQCIAEALRMYPSFWQFLRVAQRDTELLGRPVKKGTVGFMSPYLAQRDASRFQQPNEFRPDRADSSELAGELLSFGYGSRSCIGGRLAVSLVISALGALVCCRRIEPIQSHRDVQALFFGLKRVGGFGVRVYPPSRNLTRH
jgi:cytochrome P450